MTYKIVSTFSEVTDFIYNGLNNGTLTFNQEKRRGRKEEIQEG